jgi:hypothetical protein
MSNKSNLPVATMGTASRPSQRNRNRETMSSGRCAKMMTGTRFQPTLNMWPR